MLIIAVGTPITMCSDVGYIFLLYATDQPGLLISYHCRTVCLCMVVMVVHVLNRHGPRLCETI